ncbi:Putative inositol oxygenase [Glycine soja]|nr:Putative inositol oxygenase [Glycine soja]
MFSLIEQPQPSRTQAEENNEHSQKITLGLVLDGDFPLLKPPSSHDGLIVPDINSNGRSFRQEHTKAIEDVKNFKWQEIFHKYVLYSKSNVRIDVEKVKPYYMSLIEKVGMKNFSDACILSYILFNRNKPPFSAIFCTHFSFLCLQYFPQSSNGKDNRKWR